MLGRRTCTGSGSRAPAFTNLASKTKSGLTTSFSTSFPLLFLHGIYHPKSTMSSEDNINWKNLPSAIRYDEREAVMNVPVLCVHRGLPAASFSMSLELGTNMACSSCSVARTLLAFVIDVNAHESRPRNPSTICTTFLCSCPHRHGHGQHHLQTASLPTTQRI